MKGYRTYTATAAVFITALVSLLFHFGIVGAELTDTQTETIKTFLDAFVVFAAPLIAYYRSLANKTNKK